jgi:hypothetical protein
VIEVDELANWFDCDHVRFVGGLLLGLFLMEDPVVPPGS